MLPTKVAVGVEMGALLLLTVIQRFLAEFLFVTCILCATCRRVRPDNYINLFGLACRHSDAGNIGQVCRR